MEFGVVRYNELQRYIKGISFKTLSCSLKELEADGLIFRREYPQIPPKVEYSLSERGKSLMPILDGMCEWGDKNRQRVLDKAVAPFRFGKGLRLYACHILRGQSIWCPYMPQLLTFQALVPVYASVTAYVNALNAAYAASNLLDIE